MTKRVLDEVDRSVCEAFEKAIPWNRHLGLEIASLDPDRPTMRLAMRDELVGNYIHGSLHGGVVATVLDTVGGLAAFLQLLRRLEGESPEARLARLAGTGTIDLRVDYLEPALGQSFLATATIMRAGNKVAVARMEMRSDQDRLVAVGTGTYLIG